MDAALSPSLHVTKSTGHGVYQIGVRVALNFHVTSAKQRPDSRPGVQPTSTTIGPMSAVASYFFFGTYGSGVPNRIGGSFIKLPRNATTFLRITGKTQLAETSILSTG